MSNVQSGLAPPLPRPTAHRFAGREGLGGRVNTLPLVAPSVGLLLLWMIVPLAMTICFSLRRYNLLNPLIHGWAGFNNYRFLLIDPALYSALMDLGGDGGRGAGHHRLPRRRPGGAVQHGIPRP